MRIFALSIGPVFKNYTHGGSQKILREVSCYLGKRGHRVDIYCVKREDLKEEFELSDNVHVFPYFRLNQPFPLPFQTSPHNLLDMIKTVITKTKDYDVLYAHDSAFNFSLIYDSIPTVFSLRDFLYQETLVGGFNFDRDRIIVNSEYTKQCFLNTVGSLRENLSERVYLIPNGIDLDHFKKKNYDATRAMIGLDKEDIPILYPHRHEETKGVLDVLEVIANLKRRGLKKIKLLIPKYIDATISKNIRKIYQLVEEKALSLGIFENIKFHPWIPYENMPEYFSLGKLTLSLGSFIESFPNTSIESLACGTPSISSRVGAHRTILPENIEPKVDFGDVEEASEIAYRVLTDMKEFDIQKCRSYIKENFNFLKMLEDYYSVITGCKKTQKISLKQVSKSDSYVLPPWCYLSKKFGLYNDYKYGYNREPTLIRALTTKKIIKKKDLDEKILDSHLEEGNLVPIYKNG